MTAENLINIILLFFAYAFIGWCIEVTLKFFQFHRFINRGFLTGPWLPIYGSGAALITIVVNGMAPLESSIGTVFVISFIICGFAQSAAISTVLADELLPAGDPGNCSVMCFRG